MNARGMPGIMQVECIPRLWPGPGLGLKLGNAFDLHDSRHASGIHHLFAWILPGAGHLKQSQAPSRWFTDHWKRCQTDQNHQNPSRSTNMRWFGLRIRLFESQSHFLCIGKPPKIPNPTKIPQNRPVLDLHTVTPNGEIPLPGQMGSRHI